MTTSFVIVACVSDKRWFDLDAVRTEHRADPATYTGNGYTKGAPEGIAGNESMPGNPAGAPPLDWHDDTDPPPPPHDGAPMTTNTITVHIGDVHDVMATMPDASVDLLVTSPPFLALRSYLPADHPDKHREIGSEPTPAAFIDTMLDLTAEWRRIVAPTGSIAVEIGDTYSGSSGDNWHKSNDKIHAYNGSDSAPRTVDWSTGWPLPKSLCMIPELYGVALAYAINPITGTPSPAGRWRVRNWLTWTRPNPPVGALGDKFRPATSFVTVACTSDRRWFDLDAVRTEWSPTTSSVGRVNGGVSSLDGGTRMGSRFNTKEQTNPAGAPPLDWHHDDAYGEAPEDGAHWQPLHRLPTAPYAGAHYASYPLALPTKLIEAMCPREVCVVCGEARRRITRTTNAIQLEDLRHERGERRENSTGVNVWKQRTGATSSDVETLGWTDCGCDIFGLGEFRPGVVFDPFAGSGTTLLAAALAGRDAVGIDLDERNLHLIRHRIGEALLIVSERVEGDSVTFTVNRHMPGTKGQAKGQGSLFAEESA